MTTFRTYSTVVQNNKLRKQRSNLNVMLKKEGFSKDEITNVKRDFRFFGSGLLTINGKPLNVSRSEHDGKILRVSHNVDDSDIAIFVKRFNKGIESNKPDF